MAQNACMVMVPHDLFILVASRETLNLDNTRQVRDATNTLLQAFQDAQGRGEIYTFSLSQKKYNKPVSIIGLNLYEDLVFIEVRPDEQRNFLLSAVCDTSLLPEFQ